MTSFHERPEKTKLRQEKASVSMYILGAVSVMFVSLLRLGEVGCQCHLTLGLNSWHSSECSSSGDTWTQDRGRKESKHGVSGMWLQGSLPMMPVVCTQPLP